MIIAVRLCSRRQIPRGERTKRKRGRRKSEAGRYSPVLDASLSLFASERTIGEGGDIGIPRCYVVSVSARKGNVLKSRQYRMSRCTTRQASNDYGFHNATMFAGGSDGKICLASEMRPVRWRQQRRRYNGFTNTPEPRYTSIFQIRISEHTRSDGRRGIILVFAEYLPETLCHSSSILNLTFHPQRRYRVSRDNESFSGIDSFARTHTAIHARLSLSLSLWFTK